jgi:hypothetical protein
MKFGHLGTNWSLTLSQVQAHNTSTQRAVVDVLYIPSDAPTRWFVGNADGSVRELFLQTNYIKSHEATATVTHTVDANGKLSSVANVSPDAANALSARVNGLFVSIPAAFLTGKDNTPTVALTETAGVLTANVKFSADAGNISVQRADGVFTPDWTIHADSTSYVERVNGQLRVKKLLVKDVKVVTAAEIAAAGSVDAWLTANAANYQEGDMPMFPSANLTYVKSATGWEQVKMPNMTQAQILAYLNAGAFITIGTDGTIAVKVSQNAGNDIVAGTDGGLFADIDQTYSNAGPGNKTINKHLIDLYGEIAAATKSFENGITESSGVVKLGGPLTGNTEVTTGTYAMSVNGTLKTNGLQMADQFGVYFPVKLDSERRIIYVEFPN